MKMKAAIKKFLQKKLVEIARAYIIADIRTVFYLQAVNHRQKNIKM